MIWGRSRQQVMTCVDLFAGCGGMSEGFRRAGFRIVAQIDKDKFACATLQHNFAQYGTKIIEEDMRRVKFEEIQAILREKYGPKSELDVLIGGPPCRGFSYIGIRKISEPKRRHLNSLVDEFLRCVMELRPSFFVMENVTAILSKRHGMLKDILLSKMQDIGYKANVRILNAADYGVPQLRRRAFFIGNRLGLDTEFLSPTFFDPSKPPKDTTEMKPYRTLWDAISDLPVLKHGEGSERKEEYATPPLSEFQREMRAKMQPGMKIWNNKCRKHNETYLKRFAALKQGQKAVHLPKWLQPGRMDIFKDKYRRLNYSKTCFTILAHLYKDGNMFIHPTQDRTITAREAARIQSFPDMFRFTVSRLQQYKQIGNAVPVLLAEAIARTIANQIKQYNTRQE